MNYGFAEFVNTVAVIFGAILMAVGGVTFLVIASSSWIAAVSSGGLFIASGIVIIAVSQLSNATIHTARESKITNELLSKLVKSTSSGPSLTNKTSSSTGYKESAQIAYSDVVKDSDKIVFVKSYQGYKIEKIEGTRTFLVDGKDFEGIIAAEQYITSQLEK